LIGRVKEIEQPADAIEKKIAPAIGHLEEFADAASKLSKMEAQRQRAVDASKDVAQLRETGRLGTIVGPRGR
jgi:hypothetical protein